MRIFSINSANAVVASNRPASQPSGRFRRMVRGSLLTGIIVSMVSGIREDELKGLATL